MVFLPYIVLRSYSNISISYLNYSLATAISTDCNEYWDAKVYSNYMKVQNGDHKI